MRDGPGYVRRNRLSRSLSPSTSLRADGANAVVLSGETAAGAYPVESVRAMVSIVAEADVIVKD